MNKRKKIVLDVDGVLLNFIDAFDQVAHTLKDEFGKELELNKNLYHLTHRLGITQEQENIVWKKFAEIGMWENLDPLPGVIDAVKKIKDADFDIYIVTAIDEKNKEARMKNLEKIGVIPKEIHCVGYGQNKIDIINKINPDVFIDDRLEHLHNAECAYHLVWIEDDVVQHNHKDDRGVDVAVTSLKEWTDKHMPEVVAKLDEANETKIPLQRNLRFF